MIIQLIEMNIYAQKSLSKNKNVYPYIELNIYTQK